MKPTIKGKAWLGEINMRDCIGWCIVECQYMRGSKVQHNDKYQYVCHRQEHNDINIGMWHIDRYNNIIIKYQQMRHVSNIYVIY